MASLRVVLAVLAAALLLPGSASALPGDAGFGPLDPADGAVVPVDAAGIAVSYSCPVYRVSTAGEFFTVFGGPKDYAVGLATSPALDADGRLAAATRVASNSGTDIGWSESAGTCSGRVSAGGASRPQETPGTYYWQVWRLCTGCDSSYETGPVRRLEIRSTAKPVIGGVRTAYAGYPLLIPVSVAGAPTGASVVVERRSGGQWKTVGSTAVVGGAATAVATFAKVGRTTVRARVSIGSEVIVSPEQSITVRKTSSPRATTRRDDGTYADTGTGIESLALKAKVRRAGQELASVSAQVPATCPGITAGSFTTQIVAVAFPKIRVAPDGRFVAARSPDASTSFFISGRLKNRKLTEGRLTVSVGVCSASRSFTGRRT
ncbi:MAG: hypothetical protein JHD16_14200 [Solirubrobacteraceae bacterium]|nr:hypothetical protein [Solirubrobacteraceae bacterium]